MKMVWFDLKKFCKVYERNRKQKIEKVSEQKKKEKPQPPGPTRGPNTDQ
jgi:hypothetical protein